MAFKDDDGYVDADEIPTKKFKTGSSFSDILNNAIGESVEIGAKKADSSDDFVSAINAELELFEINHTKGPLLTFAYTSLMSITGTSVESERAFSSAGYLCNKFRTRLGDETLDTLCYLRSHFQKIDK